MLSNASTFFISNLILLLAIILYFPVAVTAQSERPQLIELPIQQFVPNGFVVYGKAPTQKEAGIVNTVQYQQTKDPLPDLEVFFEFGGTLELVTTNFILTKHDVVISEIMWGIDENYPANGEDTYTQWIELYNALSGASFTPQLFLLFTPFKSYSDRHIVELPNGQQALVLDAVSNLHLGRWNLPGKSGRRPYSNVVSAYRDITYAGNTNVQPHRSIIPFGSYSQSWKATPTSGRRNTLLNVIDNLDRAVRLPYVATPGTQHVPDHFLHALTTTPVLSNRVVINEIRNDISGDNLDWIELKNVSRSTVRLENWELSIVTGVGEDTDLVDLPDYEIASGEILLLQKEHPKRTVLTGGINISNPEVPKSRGATHKYFVAPALDLPNTGKFVLLLRSESDKNGQDAAIEDYAGNGFFPDTPNTEFWPRNGQPRPTETAHFGDYGSFGSLNSVWARIRYNRDDGHHRDAWTRIGTQGGIGYDPSADRSVSPGTPGYENTALKTQVADNSLIRLPTDTEYNSGEMTISEIMVDAGPRRNGVQWIELYNNSLTEAINLEGWMLEIRNLKDESVPYVNRRFIFNEAMLLPNQTLLLVSRYALNNVIENRVYNLYDQHRLMLKLSNRWSSLLNPKGFYLKLTDTRQSKRAGDDIVIDEAGNLSVIGGEPTVLWDLPVPDPSVRLSLVRQYGIIPFRSNRDGRSGTPNFAAVGTLREAWRQADRAYTRLTYYGNASDIGTPGDRLGSPLPVELSSFHSERSEAGAVLITWATESELNNAGFNILRSETRDGVFQIINPTLIPGAGTSGENHIYSFTDTTAKSNVIYYYRIEDISLEGARQTLVTVQLKGEVSARDKLTTTWGHLKTQN